MPAISFQNVSKTYSGARGEVQALSDVSFDIENRAGGAEGDNIVKTRLATGEMADIFQYNSGSLFQALKPEQTLADLSDMPNAGNISDSFKPVVSAADGAKAPGQRSLPWLMSAPAILLCTVMLLVPLVLTFVLSFNAYDAETGPKAGTFTLEHYAAVLTDPYYYAIFCARCGSRAWSRSSASSSARPRLTSSTACASPGAPSCCWWCWPR